MTNKPVFFNNHRVRKKSSNIKNENDHVNLYNYVDSTNILDIGFGDGDSIINTIRKGDQRIYGIESYTIGVSKVLDFINLRNIDNVHVYHGDVVEIIDIFPNNFFDHVNMFFPDPWPKRRHHKRRFITKFFLDKLKTKVRENNEVHIASDHINYIFDTKYVLSKYLNKKIQFSNHRLDRPITKYEKKAISKQNIIFDLIFSL